MQRRLEALAEQRGARGFTFDDLAAAAVDSGIGARDVGHWLMRARESGYLVELEPDTLSDGTVLGPQRYCLTSAAAEERHTGGHLCGDGIDGNGNGEGDASRSAPRYSERDAPALYR